jgi:hypothetical protein
MARCGCSGTSCSCVVQGSGAITVTGSGSTGSPYVIAGGGVLNVSDTATVDLSLSGNGSVGTPYVLAAAATVAMENITNFSNAGAAAGRVVAYNGTSYILQAPVTAPPGTISVGAGITGDGSVGNPLAVGGATQTYTPLWNGTTANPSIGNGSISGRYQEWGNWVDLSIDIRIGSTTNKGSGYWVWTLPVNSYAGRIQALSALIGYPNGTVRTGVAYLNGGGYITRLFVSNQSSATGASLASASLFSTLPSGGYIAITGRYEKDPS